MRKFKVPTEPLGPGLTDEQLAEAERELGLRIPSAYREVLRAMNGCLLRGGVFFQRPTPERPKGRVVGVRYLMGVGHAVRHHDLVSHNRMNSDILPEGAFEFASDSGGNGIIVFASGPRREEVAFQDHEGPFEVRPLARSLDAFLDSIVPAESPEVLEALPPIAGHAAKLVARPASRAVAKKTAAKKPAPRKATGAAKKTAAKKTVAKKAAPRRAKGAAKKAAQKATSQKPSAKSRR